MTRRRAMDSYLEVRCIRCGAHVMDHRSREEGGQKITHRKFCSDRCRQAAHQQRIREERALLKQLLEKK
jgi:endogenous inhibitor of DNA gyrase (YacG/DUF329 family)